MDKLQFLVLIYYMSGKRGGKESGAWGRKREGEKKRGREEV